jgi:hypothetical protein
MRNLKKANRCVEVLEALIERHIEKLEDEKDSVFVSRDECLFLWVPLLKLALKSYGHGAFIRHAPNDNKLVDKLQLLTEILVERLLIDKDVFKEAFADKIPEMEKEIKSENESIYKYISGKDTVWSI